MTMSLFGRTCGSARGGASAVALREGYATGLDAGRELTRVSTPGKRTGVLFSLSPSMSELENARDDIIVHAHRYSSLRSDNQAGQPSCTTLVRPPPPPPASLRLTMSDCPSRPHAACPRRSPIQPSIELSGRPQPRIGWSPGDVASPAPCNRPAFGGRPGPAGCRCTPYG